MVYGKQNVSEQRDTGPWQWDLLVRELCRATKRAAVDVYDRVIRNGAQPRLQNFLNMSLSGTATAEEYLVVCIIQLRE